MDLKRSLAICMAEANINQKDLALRMGIIPANISRINMTGTCTTSTLISLAKAFNMPVYKFIKKGEVIDE